jgi:hypothetical protein
MLDPTNRQTLTQRYAPDLRQHLPPMLADYLAEALKYPIAPGFRGLPMGGPSIQPPATSTTTTSGTTTCPRKRPSADLPHDGLPP